MSIADHSVVGGELVGSAHEARALARTRQRLFIAVGLAVLVGGGCFTLLQPAEYRSTATVLMTAATAIDERVTDTDVQGVAIQHRTLLGNELLQRLSARLHSQGLPAFSAGELRELLQVTQVPSTHLLELAARGGDAAALPDIVDQWVAAYSELRAGEIAQRQAQTIAELQSQVHALGAQVLSARTDLDAFRDEHGIDSTARGENAVLARLEGLNDALNNAQEEQVRAQAQLDTLRAAVSGGELVVPEVERAEVAAMAEELGRLRAQLTELQARYTDAYIRRDARLRDIPEQIESLEAAIGRAYGEGSSVALQNAERAYQTATAAVEELQHRLEEQRADATTFDSLYAEYLARVGDLERLEELRRDTRARLATIEASEVDRIPQLSVIEPPSPLPERLGPNYWLLTGASLTAALVAAIFAVWLHGLLNPRRREAPIVAVAGMALPPHRGEMRSLEEDPAPRLE